MQNLFVTHLYSNDCDPEDTFAPYVPVVIELMSDEEARQYADSLTREEAREHLNAHLTSTEVE